MPLYVTRHVLLAAVVTMLNAAEYVFLCIRTNRIDRNMRRNCIDLIITMRRNSYGTHPVGILAWDPVRCRVLEILLSHVANASPTAITSTGTSSSTSFLKVFHGDLQNKIKETLYLFSGHVSANQQL